MVSAQSHAYAGEPCAPTDANGPGCGASRVIETNFGPVALDSGNSISLPRGLLGFSEHQDFALTHLPDPRLEQFMLLQSLEEPQLSFLLLPLGEESDVLTDEDKSEIVQALGLREVDVAFLFIVTIRKIGDGVTLTFNKRAPVVIDARTRTGFQHVLSNSTYQIQQPL